MTVARYLVSVFVIATLRVSSPPEIFERKAFWLLRTTYVRGSLIFGYTAFALQDNFVFYLSAVALLSWNWSQMIHTTNASYLIDEDYLDVNTDIYSKLLVTVIYAALFVVGCLGNSVTLYIMCKRDSPQNLQSTVHYHLTSLAASDLLILILCMPVELYNFIWVHHPWAFGDVVCRGYYFLRDGCSYATALNIASLSMERYMALCHPFRAKRVVSRGRTRRLICGLWLASFLLASSMLFVMGQHNMGHEMICTTIVSTATVKIVLQVGQLDKSQTNRHKSVCFQSFCFSNS